MKLTTILSLLLTTCTLDTSDKLACVTSADCLSGYVCNEAERICQATGNQSTSKDIAAPTLLEASRDGAKLLLQWKDNATNESGYVVEGRHGVAELFETLAELAANSTSYQHTLTEKGDYSFRIYAVMSGPKGTVLAQSATSNELELRLEVPSSPEVEWKQQDEIVLATWNTVDFKQETEDCGYRIYNRPCTSPEMFGIDTYNGTPVKELPRDTTTFSSATFFGAIFDEYVIVAFNRWGESLEAIHCITETQ